jgi:hypothetical protein
MYGHSARYCDWGRDKELKGSKVVVTPVESGDTLQEVAPILPLEAQGGWEQECFISIKDTEGVGSTEDKDKGRDNKDKDSMVKDWGLQSETGRGLGEAEEGEERKKEDRKRWREDQIGEKRELGENIEIKGRVRGRGRVRGHREVKGDDTRRVTMGDKDGIKGRVRGGGSVWTSVRKRRVYEESIPVTKLPGRRDLF